MIKLPQYRKLYELLRQYIQEGVYKEGDLLPSENELCRIHNMTRPTVRQALDALVRDGFIKKQQGKGSIVNPLPKGIGILSVEGTTSAIGKSKLETKILEGPILKNWDENFFFPISNIEKDAGCIYMKRLRIYEGRPIFIDINFLPNLNLPRFTNRKFENKSLFDTLRKYYNIHVVGGEQKLWAIKANEEISKLLNLNPGDPVLHLERKIATNRVNFHIYSSVYCNTNISPIYGTF